MMSDVELVKSCFTFLDRIDLKTQQNIFWQGIRDWDDFLSRKKIRGISERTKGHYDRMLRKAKKHLEQEDLTFFTKNLPSRESWRFFPLLKDSVVYLDIELSSFNDIAIVGLYDGEYPKVLVKGYNLETAYLKRAFEGCNIIITFNGSSFDLPRLRKVFGDIIPDVINLDLRFAASRVGLTGGLKEIEEILGIERLHDPRYDPEKVPISLWNRWMKTKKEKFLRDLIEYNREDVMNLEPLAEHVVKRLSLSEKAQDKAYK